MRHKNLIYAIVLLILGIETHAQTWIPVSSSEPKAPEIEVISSDANQFVFKITIPGYYDTYITEAGTTYHALELMDCQTLDKVGEPALPVFNLLIGIPYGCECLYQMTNAQWDDKILGKVYPYQKPLFETESRSGFDLNDSIYALTQYNSYTCQLGETMRWNGMNNATLSICPFRFYPRVGRLFTLKEATVTVTFAEKDSGDEPDAPTPNVDDPQLKSGLANYNAALFQSYYVANAAGVAAGQSTDQASYDYLIISTPNTAILNSASMSDFCFWKALKGHQCKVVSTVATGATCTSIKNYIQNEVRDKGVKYVLFIGDHGDIPLYPRNCSGKTVKSDYWYACMDGDSDVQADIAIGRFCVTSEAELTNMVDKTIVYEKCPVQDDWSARCLLVAHQQAAPEKYQGCSEEIRTGSYIHPLNFEKVYGAAVSKGGTAATNQTVVDAINTGTGIVNYRGHGSQTGWASGWSSSNLEFNEMRVNQLTNTERFPVVFSIACQNGDISYSGTCLLEAFTRKATGAVAFLGATESTYTKANHTYDKNLFQTICNDGIYEIGNINNMANLKSMTAASNSFTSVFNAFAYLWGGDPSLELWTGTVSTLDNVDVSKNGTVVTVSTNGDNDCRVILVSEDGAYISERTGSGTFTVLDAAATYYVAVNKHNCIPYIARINSTDIIYLQNESLDGHTAIISKRIIAGKNVTSQKAPGPVIVRNGAKVILKAENGVTLDGGFECEEGAQLTIQ